MREREAIEVLCNKENFIKRMRKRDEAAILFAIDKYLPIVKPAVQKILYRFGKNEMIEECINDIFLSIWENINKFHGENPDDFKKWIYKIAKYKAIDRYRQVIKNSNKEISLEEWQEEGSQSAEDTLVALEDRKELIELINTLEPMDKTIFIMKFFWGEKSEEIAQKLGITRAAVDNRIYRGKRKLNQKLEVV